MCFVVFLLGQICFLDYLRDTDRVVRGVNRSAAAVDSKEDHSEFSGRAQRSNFSMVFTHNRQRFFTCRDLRGAPACLPSGERFFRASNSRYGSRVLPQTTYV